MMGAKTASLIFVFIFTAFLVIVVGANGDVEGQDYVTTSISSKEETGTIRKASDLTNRPDFQQRKWVSQLFAEAQTRFRMSDHIVNAQCKKDFELYGIHLQNQSVWAVRMLESSQWPSFGIFGGTLEHFGSYEECLQISSYGIEGQYCLADASYNFDVNESSLHVSRENDHADEADSVWKAIKIYLEDPVRVNRHNVRWAMCIPSSCRHIDLEMSLDEQLKLLFNNQGLNITIYVNPMLCSKRRKSNFASGYYFVRALYGVIVSLVVSATFYDIVTKKCEKKSEPQSALFEAFSAFSFKKNWNKLLQYNPKVDVIGINTIKVINMLLIIYGHRFIYFFGFPKFQSETVEEAVYKLSRIELIHTSVVDVFFTVSGFLISYFGFTPMVKEGYFYIVLNIVSRWIRMIPVFGLLTLFIINIMPYLNDGPLWDFRIQREVDNCQYTWWANLLVISNIVKTDKQCLIISWYISTDIQLTVIGCILLFILSRNRKFGIIMAIMIFITASCITFAVAYINKFHGILRLYISLLEEPRNNPEFTNFYIGTYTRVGPYMVGFMSAYVARILKERNFKFTGKQTLLLGILSLLIGEGSQYYGFLFYVFGRPYYRLENALYAVINRSLFTLPYGVILCIYLTSGLGWFGKIIERRIFLTLGRLTYSVFLVNTTIQLIQASSQKQIMPTSTNLNLLWFAAGDILLSYLFGFVLYLFAEGPVANISKVFQRKITASLMKSMRVRDNVVVGSISSDLASDKSPPRCENKIVAVEVTYDHTEKNGYRNHSYITNESIPKESESSKF